MDEPAANPALPGAPDSNVRAFLAVIKNIVVLVDMMKPATNRALDPAGLQGRHCIHGDIGLGDRHIGVWQHCASPHGGGAMKNSIAPKLGTAQAELNLPLFGAPLSQQRPRIARGGAPERGARLGTCEGYDHEFSKVLPLRLPSTAPPKRPIGFVTHEDKKTPKASTLTQGRKAP